jgi:hypothetical protein
VFVPLNAVDKPNRHSILYQVRDIDYEQHQSGQPHTLTWTNKICGPTNVSHDIYTRKGLILSFP